MARRSPNIFNTALGKVDDRIRSEGIKHKVFNNKVVGISGSANIVDIQPVQGARDCYHSVPWWAMADLC